MKGIYSVEVDKQVIYKKLEVKNKILAKSIDCVKNKRCSFFIPKGVLCKIRLLNVEFTHN